jgi:hypothetical protein
VQAGLVLAGSEHWNGPVHTPRHWQVGALVQAAGTVTQ